MEQEIYIKDGFLLRGKLIKKVNVEKGFSKSGLEWSKQSFLIDISLPSYLENFLYTSHHNKKSNQLKNIFDLEKFVEESTLLKAENYAKNSMMQGLNLKYQSSIICFQLFGNKKIKMLENYIIGDQLEVRFIISTNVVSGKYFSNFHVKNIFKLKLKKSSSNLNFWTLEDFNDEKNYDDYFHTYLGDEYDSNYDSIGQEGWQAWRDQMD